MLAPWAYGADHLFAAILIQIEALAVYRDFAAAVSNGEEPSVGAVVVGERFRTGRSAACECGEHRQEFLVSERFQTERQFRAFGVNDFHNIL